MAFEGNVVTNFNWRDLERQVRNKVNEIAQDQGRTSHGPVHLGNNVDCQHWRAGNYRIFGTYNMGTNQFDFIGWGTHVGRGNRSYTVELPRGRTRATTT